MSGRDVTSSLFSAVEVAGRGRVGSGVCPSCGSMGYERVFGGFGLCQRDVAECPQGRADVSRVTPGRGPRREPPPLPDGKLPPGWHRYGCAGLLVDEGPGSPVPRRAFETSALTGHVYVNLCLRRYAWEHWLDGAHLITLSQREVDGLAGFQHDLAKFVSFHRVVVDHSVPQSVRLHLG